MEKILVAKNGEWVNIQEQPPEFKTDRILFVTEQGEAKLRDGVSPDELVKGEDFIKSVGGFVSFAQMRRMVQFHKGVWYTPSSPEVIFDLVAYIAIHITPGVTLG